ncbi:esterase family protein [Phycicoccus sp. HDW14]|uniref:alpha/beta hydrolase n=1 Tax=Phycicoccus sp. HDW14 TaxID=2714941 RepID=UPI0014086D09|nr:alpha/beta hydrolase-fold protein [Phycicoccus sp. HDW14]QIM21769.1 esterase family protein [Phycicoccus sp. HDW14]
MSLTGRGLVVLVAGLLVVVFVAALLDVPRLRRPLPATAARGAKVLLVGALAVLLSGVVLNDQYLFYVSWGDLVGSTGTGTTTSFGGGAGAASALARLGPGLRRLHPPSSLPPLPQPGRSLQEWTVPSSSLGAAVRVFVELPPGYDPASPRTYPVVVGLHGFPSVPLSYVGAGLPRAEEQQAAAGRIADAIIVVPQVNAPEGYDTECVNAAGGGTQVDTWLGSELPRWVVGHLRVRTDRESWAAVGYSFGGWCAASVTLRHPDVYGAFIDLQGYFRPDFGTTHAPDVPGLSGYDLVRLEQKHPVPVSAWVETSRQDSLSYPSTSAFLRAVRAPTAVRAVVLARGGHRSAVWQPLLPSAFRWLGRTLSGFHP